VEVVAVELPPGAQGAASIAGPLILADLPVFLRWRGDLPASNEPFVSLIGLADRLIVDSAEWADPDAGYARLLECRDLAAVSDLSWRKLEPWRRAIAACWPQHPGLERLVVAGPALGARLVAAWLAARLQRPSELDHRGAPSLLDITLDGEPIPPPRLASAGASELLSADLDQVHRDPVFEEAACGLSSVTN
jgi:glucose-6-phosphate dehydrogenase assembly protein OpcA